MHAIFDPWFWVMVVGLSLGVEYFLRWARS